ncbi:MAG: hypothetical protein NC095_12020 [Muribaculum sp.]|nr:hypothetical protein [Muribaculum sp.]
MSDNDKKNLQNLDFGDFFVILHWRWTVFPIASGMVFRFCKAKSEGYGVMRVIVVGMPEKMNTFDDQNYEK